MSDYYKIVFKITPYIEDAADLLAAFLADTRYDSFQQTTSGLEAYVEASLFKEETIKEIIKDFPMECDISYSYEFIPHTDWNEEWEKKYFNPLVLAEGRCVVRSSFHKDFPHAEMEILVDPKMAFGTGHHATTAMMVNHLFHQEIIGKSVLDMGTGTGILAIVAKKLGAKSVTGIEIDPDAYANALENASLNGVDIDLLKGDAALLENFKDIDIFLANINRNIIIADLAAYIQCLKINGNLILSGFYLEDVPIIENELRRYGMKVAETVTEGKDKWASVRAVKTGD